MVGVMGSIVASWFGGWDTGLATLVVFMGIDYVSGIIVAGVFQKKEAEELYALAAAKKLVLLEAIKTAYCPGFVQLVGIAKSGAIGRICDVEACFTKLEKPENREWGIGVRDWLEGTMPERYDPPVCTYSLSIGSGHRNNVYS